MSIAMLSSAVAPQAFNSDFYVTAASVIPVLFLAVALQSTFQQDLLAWVFRPMRSTLYGRPATTVRESIKLCWTVLFGGIGAPAVGLLIISF